VVGHLCGKINIFDFKRKEVIETIQAGSQPIDSLLFINKGLHFVVGNSEGQLKLYDFKSKALVSTVDKAHLQK